MQNLGGNSFSAREFDKWLEKAKSNIYNLDIMTLFMWEQRYGRWQSMSQTEWDIAVEIFDPCNCRALLMTLLSVPEKYRKGPEYVLFEELMKNMWPDVLCEPINPELKGTAAIIADRIVKTNVHTLIPKRIRNIIRRTLLNYNLLVAFALQPASQMADNFPLL